MEMNERHDFLKTPHEISIRKSSGTHTQWHMKTLISMASIDC